MKRDPEDNGYGMWVTCPCCTHGYRLLRSDAVAYVDWLYEGTVRRLEEAAEPEDFDDRFDSERPDGPR